MLAARSNRFVALGVGGEGLQPELADQRQDPVLGRADPLAPDLDHLAVADRLVQGAPADPVARLEHADVAPGGAQRPGGAETRQAGPDHRYVYRDFVFFRLAGGHRRADPKGFPRRRRQEPDGASEAAFRADGGSLCGCRHRGGPAHGLVAVPDLDRPLDRALAAQPARLGPGGFRVRPRDLARRHRGRLLAGDALASLSLVIRPAAGHRLYGPSATSPSFSGSPAGSGRPTSS